MIEALKPWLTIETLTLAMVLVGYAVAFLRWLAPRTEWKGDDRAVAVWDDFRLWLYRMAPFAWQVVEDLARKGIIQKTDKRDEYFTRLETAFQAAFNTQLPGDLKADADLIAAGKSAQDHADRLQAGKEI